MPSTRAASVVQAMGLDDMDAASRNRKRIGPAVPAGISASKTPGRRKVSLAVPKALQLHKGSEDATDERFARAAEQGEVVGKVGAARHFSNPFRTLARKQYLNPGDTKAAVALNDALYEAGTKYERAYEGAHLGPLRAGQVGPHMPRSTAPRADGPEHAMSCRNRVHEVEHVIGPRLIGLVNAVVLEGKSLESVALQYGTSKNKHLAAIEVRVRFVEALHLLVRHWRMYPYPQGEVA